MNNVKHLESEDDGEMATFFRDFTADRLSLNIVSACYSGDWIEYSISLDLCTFHLIKLV